MPEFGCGSSPGNLRAGPLRISTGEGAGRASGVPEADLVQRRRILLRRARLDSPGGSCRAIAQINRVTTGSDHETDGRPLAHDRAATHEVRITTVPTGEFAT